ncbi:MAG TPA: hypothetical protein VM221_06705 [Armatimonadota bacterium]|nr:hypothetical protein [Armatimonadota bacterium]
MSDRLVTLVFALAYLPLAAMALLWVIALGLRLAGAPGLLRWLKARTSVPQPEPNPPPGARGEGQP